ncbi:MAG: hypothetical protein FJZ38_03350 [Candidatus Rokubacteria bacterium]|nr:hypothetical protein [Candidatus Rokubacteria bacterium]
MLLRHAPTIVEAAHRYYTGARRTADDHAPASPSRARDELERAVDRLEQREVEQARIVADLAKQVAEMTTALEVIRARLTIALWGVAISGGVALLFLVLALARG